MSSYDGVPDYTDQLDAVVGSILEDAAGSEAFGGAVEAYLDRSEQVSGELGVDDGPEISLTPDRSRLYWAAIGDLLVFRALCVAEFEDMLASVPADVLAALDAQRYAAAFPEERGRILGDLETVTRGYRVAWGARGGDGSALGDLSATVHKSIDAIVEDSTAHVIDAGFGALKGLLPAAGWVDHGRVMKVITSAARRIHIDAALAWGQRLLELATAKLHRLFGPRFDEVVENTKDFLARLTRIRERIGDELYQTIELRKESDRIIAALRDGGMSPWDLDDRTAEVEAVVDRYEKWSRGIEIGTTGLGWAGRLASFAPLVAAALAAAGAALTAGAYLIGQYHLDWPHLSLPWQTDGVLNAIS